MSRGKPVVLSTRSFEKQGDAVDFFKAMLGRYKVGDRVADLDALDLSSLLERHDEYEKKAGVGVDHYTVIMTEHGTPCFRITRKDGTGTDFSYRHCVTMRPPTRKQEVSAAFRRAVRFDLYGARDEFYAANKGPDSLIVCGETGERISLQQAHMDHRMPFTFEVIVTSYLAARGLKVDDVPLTTGQDDQVSPELLDAELREDFRRYHAEIALLDLVKNTANLAQSSRQRLRPTRIKLT
jgi:hypothetical protein